MSGSARRLLGLGDEPADGNALLALLALTGAVGWGATALAVNGIVPLPAGNPVDGLALGEWATQALTPTMWPVMVVWGVVWFGGLALARRTVDRASFVAAPNLVWIVVTTLATLIDVYAVVTASLELIWIPWPVAFAVGYLATAVLVERSGVYWLAGLVSAALAVYSGYAVLTDTGHSVASTGVVLSPVPFVYVVLGLIHVLPMAIDAARGGREMTPQGLPALRVGNERGPSRGGVVPDD